MTKTWQPARAARWLAEAFESGNPLAPLPEDFAPQRLEDAEEVAAAVLEELAITPCGLRLLRRGDAPAVAGPMIEARLLRSGAPVPLGALRHPVVTAAVVGVLAEPLEPEDDAPPTFTRLHPAIDVSATRFTAPPEDELTLTADLARLGYVVAGKGTSVAPAAARAALGAAGVRLRGTILDLPAALASAAAVARRWGGLPAGALLIVGGLGPPVPAEGTLRAAVTGLRSAEVTFD